MELKHIFKWTVLLLPILLSNLIRTIEAMPATYTAADNYYVPAAASDRADGDYYAGAPLTNYRLNQLRRGYYYVDDGFITAVAPSAFAPVADDSESGQRRLDSRTGGSRYKPLVNIRQTKTKRKKLFVPNFFG